MKKIFSLGRVVMTILATGALLGGAVGVGVVAPASATATPGAYYATGTTLTSTAAAAIRIPAMSSRP